jgi:hypothetical protein
MSNAILGAELSLKRTFPGDDNYDPFIAGARIDLVLLRTDKDGTPFIELVDWKTGRRGWANPFAPVISRYVATPLIHRHLPAGTNGTVVWTEFFVAERNATHTALTLPRCLEAWEQVKVLVDEIDSETVFPPAPSPQTCRFCPFAGNGCDAAMPEADDGNLW